VFNKVYIVFIQKLNTEKNEEIYGVYTSKKKAFEAKLRINGDVYSAWVLEYKNNEIALHQVKFAKHNVRR
jgi:hypothetical protein